MNAARIRLAVALWLEQSIAIGIVRLEDGIHEENAGSSRQDNGFGSGLQAEAQDEGSEATRAKDETRCKERLGAVMYIIPQQIIDAILDFFDDLNTGDSWSSVSDDLIGFDGQFSVRELAQRIISNHPLPTRD